MSYRILFSSVICLAALSACNGGGSASSSGSRISGGLPLAFGEIRVRFVPGRDVEVIEVSTLDRTAIKSATLVMPGRGRVTAFDIDTQPDPSVSGAATSAALAYRPNYTLATPGGPLPIQGMPQTASNAIGQTLSIAQIRVPDMQTYKHYWAKAQIDVIEGEGASEQRTTLSAPPPQ